jgi:hypothetical protein
MVIYEVLPTSQPDNPVELAEKSDVPSQKNNPAGPWMFDISSGQRQSECEAGLAFSG